MKGRISKTKVCRRCGQEKPASEFNIDTDSSDGLQGECRKCLQARYFKSRGYRPLHRFTDGELRAELALRAKERGRDGNTSKTKRK